MKKLLGFIFFTFFIFSCGKGIAPDETYLSKKVMVFGVGIYATETIPDAKILRAAKVMAQYLDSNEDGTIDDSNVVNKLIKNKACIVITPDADTTMFPANIPCNYYQDLYENEIKVNGSSSSDGFDATLEEVLHLISHHGYAYAYPEIFGMISYGENNGSALTNAMDKARGGFTNSIPDSYPSGSWYTYNDDSCNYICQASEYFYWALTTKLGMQEYTGRADENANEWKVESSSDFTSTDTEMNAILSKSGAYSGLSYSLPDASPDTSYTPTSFSVEAVERP
ncbi:hypothetical protein OAK75_08340 [Bacteriovoracales bacterium]|nr:hypothetical protein [Bacteriovoracales bacterium]